MLRFLNITILLVWTVFLAWLLTYGRGDLIRLLHPRLWWILGVAVTVLILFVATLMIPGGHALKRKSLTFELPGILILLIPLLYFLIAKDARLDGTSLENRIIRNDNGIYLNNLPSFDTFDGSMSPDMAFSKILRKPEEYEGQDVEVVCQSLVSADLPDDTAMCYRYMITCCAADALPAFFFLKYQDASQIENNRWIKVSGPLAVIRNNDMVFPSVEVSELKYVKEPSFPWAM